MLAALAAAKLILDVSSVGPRLVRYEGLIWFGRVSCDVRCSP